MARVEATPTLPFLSPDVYDGDVNSWEYARDSVESSIGESLGASFDDALYNSPTAAIGRILELSKHTARQPYVDNNGQTKYRYGDGKEHMSVEDWKQSEYYRDGLKFEESVHPDVARILAERYDEREARNKILRNAPNSGWMTAGNIGAGFVASMIDPINLATSFIPVVGQARWVERGAGLAKAAKRFGAGAFEAGVMTAATEPIVYYASKQEQGDYTANDVMLSIAFGATMGGAFNAAGRALSDRFSKKNSLEASKVNDAPSPVEVTQSPIRDLSPQGHLNVLRTVLAQQADGRAVDVVPVLEAEGFFEATTKARSQTILPVRDAEGVLHFDNPRQAKRWIEKNKKEDANYSVKRNDDATAQVTIKHEGKLHADGQTVKVFDKVKAAKNEINKLPEAERNKAHVIELPKEGKKKDFVIVRNVTKSEAEAIQAQYKADGTKATDLKVKSEPVSFRQYMDINEKPFDPSTMERNDYITARVKRNYDTRDPLPVDEKPRVIDETNSLPSLEKELDDLYKRLDLDDVAMRELAELDSMINNLDTMDEIINEGIQCLAKV